MTEPFERYVEQPDPTQKLWRYMDLSKFLSLLQTSKLFFAQWKMLGDPMEGFYSWLADIMPPGTELGQKLLMEFLLNPAMPFSSYLISCWSANDFESAALWHMYTNAMDSVAIQTTVTRLLDSIDPEIRSQLRTGLVKYYYGEPPEPGDKKGSSSEHIIYHKREIFRCEQEYRLLFQAEPATAQSLSGGMLVATDLNTLIESVYISPFANSWLKDLLSTVIGGKYGLTFEISDSLLRQKPFENQQKDS